MTASRSSRASRPPGPCATAPLRRLTATLTALGLGLGMGLSLAGCDRNPGTVSNRPATDGHVAMGAGTDGTGTSSVHNPGGLAQQGHPGASGVVSGDAAGGADHVGSTRTTAGVTTNGNGLVLPTQGQAGTQQAGTQQAGTQQPGTGPSGDALDRLPATAAGAQPGPAGSMPAAALAAADRNFIALAAEGGLFEVEAGRLASERAQHDGVKAFGATLSSDHGDANQRLRDLAAAKGVTLPTTVSAAQRTLLQKLGQASGADFDRQFIAEVGIRAHQQDIAAFQRAAKSAKDADIRAFASATLPTLQHHLATARQLGAGSGAGSAAAGAKR